MNQPRALWNENLVPGLKCNFVLRFASVSKIVYQSKGRVIYPVKSYKNRDEGVGGVFRLTLWNALGAAPPSLLRISLLLSWIFFSWGAELQERREGWQLGAVTSWCQNWLCGGPGLGNPLKSIENPSKIFKILQKTFQIFRMLPKSFKFLSNPFKTFQTLWNTSKSFGFLWNPWYSMYPLKSLDSNGDNGILDFPGQHR